MYKIMGADQTEYGPVASDQVRQWITQGRANGQTLASFEGTPWKPLSTFPEFADILRTAVPPPFQPAMATQYPGAQTNVLAVTGLILCIVGTCCSPLSLVGLVLCVIGLSQIQKNPHLYTTGKIVPIIGIIVALLDIVLLGVFLASGRLSDILRNFPR
jgi:hypothetical protein